MEKLSKEELLKVLAKAVAPVKTRKKAERSEEQQKELSDRLAKMREKSLEVRSAKKKEKEAPSPLVSKALDLAKSEPPPRDDIFEKKYGSTLERITEVLGRVDTNMNDLKEMKRLKAEARRLEKEDLEKNAPPPPPPKEEFAPASPKMAEIIQPLNPTPYVYTPLSKSYVPTPVSQDTHQPYKFGDFKRMNFGKKR